MLQCGGCWTLAKETTAQISVEPHPMKPAPVAPGKLVAREPVTPHGRTRRVITLNLPSAAFLEAIDKRARILDKTRSAYFQDLAAADIASAEGPKVATLLQPLENRPKRRDATEPEPEPEEEPKPSEPSWYPLNVEAARNKGPRVRLSEKIQRIQEDAATAAHMASFYQSDEYLAAVERERLLTTSREELEAKPQPLALPESVAQPTTAAVDLPHSEISFKAHVMTEFYQSPEYLTALANHLGMHTFESWRDETLAKACNDPDVFNIITAGR